MSRRYAKAHECPTPSKRRYGSLYEAKGDLERQQAKAVLSHMHLATWAYVCVCGWYHRTKSRDALPGAVDLDTIEVPTDA